MNVPVQLALALFSTAAAAPAAPAGGWQLGPGVQISYSEAGAPVYKLDCTGPELVVTQFGVTRLLDLEKNQPVGDTEGSTMPPGASVMALATDKTEPDMVAASAVRNAGAGWDMTIRLPKNDPAFLSLPRAGYVSLFTTGFTLAVTLGKDDRKLLSTFVRQCGG
jgi:hypothetical protein